MNLIGSLLPASVGINAAKNYTVSGSGSLDGAMDLTKAGSGTLTILNTNSYTGNTTISNGSLIIAGTGSFGNTAIALSAGSLSLQSSGTGGGYCS